MKMVFQQKVQEKEAKLKQSEEELYARHKEMKDALEKQRLDLEDKKHKIESGRPLTPEKSSVCILLYYIFATDNNFFILDYKKEGFPSHVKHHLSEEVMETSKNLLLMLTHCIVVDHALPLDFISPYLKYNCLATLYLDSCEYSSLFSARCSL